MYRFRAVAVLAGLVGLVACDRRATPVTAPVLNSAVQFASTGPANAVTGAVNTILNLAADGPGHCANGQADAVNCNLYAGKKFVWLVGDPVQQQSGLADGTYFFAVLEPGGQSNPNDGGAGVLSDLDPSTGTGAGDTYRNRTFSITDGVIFYLGDADEVKHGFANNKIRLAPYDDTPNPGGEYVMAVCKLADATHDYMYPVDPSDCKFDNFKVADQPPPAHALTATKTAAGTNDRKYSWTITKAVDKTVVNTGTGTFNYTVIASRDAGMIGNVRVAGSITLSNPNNGSVAITSVTDVLSNGTTCLVNNAPTTLAPGNTTLTYSCELNSLPTQPLNNTATVSWAAQDVGGMPLAAGGVTASVTGIQFTEVPIDASANVTDSQVADGLGSTSATKTFTYAKIFDNNPAGTCTSHDNTATFTTSDLHATGSASQSVKVCVGANLTASKTVAPSFTRSYAWGITKAVDKTVVKQVGGSATFAYTVNANQTGSTDSNWLVSGSITVNNPNNWEAVTVNLSDAIDNGGSCTVTGGSNVSVPASGSVSANYTCSYAAAPAAAFTNTATAAWNAGDATTPDGTAAGTASGAFAAPTTTINSSVNVQDTFNGSATTLGTLTASDATLATGSWTYTHIIAVVANTCLTYNNTAAYTSNSGTTGSASRSVTVCGNVAGGLTKGFWQNKNGQAIITGGSATAGICNSATWLRQYAPFQDMNVAATCVQVASYAMNIIKAADASGAAMNAMLKAQMLATSLDVYFSDAALGGNKIAAPVALGGVKVDLTAICSTISLCSSTYANVSAAFGGATALTVSQILSYAAAQSNAGGSAWYGQVKAVQEMAKNTFDAINNAVALVSP